MSVPLSPHHLFFVLFFYLPFVTTDPADRVCDFPTDSFVIPKYSHGKLVLPLPCISSLLHDVQTSSLHLCFLS